jgi:nucleotide-binding universal stress UspA family protein
MRSFGDGAPAGDTVPANGRAPGTQQALRRVLIPVADTTQVENVVELARRAGVSEARVLHLNLREIAGGRRFTLETDAAASEIVEAAVFELRMAGIASSGQVRSALVGRVAQEIVAEATEWGADLIVLGFPRRGELMTRLFGSVTLRVLEHAPCPVVVASPAGEATAHLGAASTASVTGTGPDPDVHDRHPLDGRGDNLSTTPAR